MRFLLDSHILVRWLSEPKRLSREQLRIIREAERRREQVGLSAASLVEIAIMRTESRRRAGADIGDFFTHLEESPIFVVLPITIQIALDAGRLSVLRDPADRTIVATARVHGLRLLTSDERIIDSELVPVVD